MRVNVVRFVSLAASLLAVALAAGAGVRPI